jgi:endonuclease/exonuclease/phosphatase family metal-dependent hydrolase
MTLKLLSLNVEQDKHLTTAGEFIERENADIVALMEVCEDNLATLLPTYPYRVFKPNFHLDGRKVGVVLASRLPFVTTSHFYADGVSGEEIPPHGMGTHRPLTLFADIRVGEKRYSIAATHFTWTPDRSETEKQHADLDRLLDYLGDRELLMCGDFNIPRGNGAYKKLARRYRDNIPSSTTTTIDPLLHRGNMTTPGTLSVVVDYVWSTPQYTVQNVKIVRGVSDHCGVTAIVDIV